MVYKRFVKGIMDNPPPPYTCMVVVTNKGVLYSRIAFCIAARVDSTGAYAVCVKRKRDAKGNKTKKKDSNSAL